MPSESLDPPNFTVVAATAKVSLCSSTVAQSDAAGAGDGVRAINQFAGWWCLSSLPSADLRYQPRPNHRQAPFNNISCVRHIESPSDITPDRES